ncbi:MAG: ATP-binding cassette domain-containing protein [Cyclobacteriaceae bacterium]|nr:ATP-binding cassette domain-containing protein [Cyclobacteriaceae bacterium]
MNTETIPSESNVIDKTQRVIEIRNLEKSFGDRRVLNKVNLEVFARENLAVLGRSGSGKSVLIKCIVGLLKPDSGVIQVLGYDVPSLSAAELNELRLQVGFSFQGSALYDSMSIRQNLEFPLKRNLGIFDKKELDDKIMTSLKEVGLEHTVDQKPAELSGGMKKRIGIARTLILKPKIMLYDEPTSGLDPVTAAEINELILEVRDRYHTASIIITHDISCARQTSDRIVALINGESKLNGTFEELKATHDEELERFFNY